MDLEHESAEGRYRHTQCGDTIFRRPNLDVEGCHQIVQGIAADDMAAAPEAIERAPRSVFRETQRVFPAIGDKKAS